MRPTSPAERYSTLRPTTSPDRLLRVPLSVRRRCADCDGGPCTRPRALVRVVRTAGRSSIAVGAVLLGLAFGWAGAGAAQTASASADPGTLESVIVTARKREEALAEVPMSISVFSADVLATYDIQVFTDYATKTPNLSFAYGTGTTGISAARTVAIRGITGQNLFGTSSATGYYIDDTPVPASVDPRVLDVENIEVLRGPQGTLFGESSLGGNVRMVTRKPSLIDDRLGYMGQAGVTSGGGSVDAGAGLIGNLVLSPNVAAVRIVLFADHDAGYLTRSYPDPTGPGASNPFASAPRTSVGDQGAQTSFGGSITTAFNMTDALEARLRFMFQNTRDKGFAATFAPLPAFKPEYSLDRAYDVQPKAYDIWSLPSLDLTYRGDGFSVVSSTSYFHRQNRDVEDSTYGTQQILSGYYGVAALPSQPFLWDQEHFQNQLTEELRLNFDAKRDISGTIGALYSRTRSKLAIPPTYASGLVAATANNTVVGPWPNDLLWTDYNPQTQDDFSLFGEMYWKFLSRFTATFGARQYWLKQTTDFTADGFNNFGPTLSAPEENRQSGLSPKIGLAYQATDTAMVYASASKGFRAGSAQPYLPFCALPALPITDITQVKSDTLWTYEVGTKLRVSGTGVLISAAAFHINWNNLQQQVALPCGAYIVINGDAAQINGAEVELAGAVTPSFQIRFSVGYEKTNISNPGPLGIVGIVRGSRVLGTPAWNASLAGAYSTPLTGRVDGFVAADVSYTGDSLSLLNGGGGALATRSSYTLANLRIGVRRGDSEVSLNVRNLTNAKPNLGDIGYVGYAQYTSGGAIIPQVATLPPATFVLQYRHQY